MTVEQVTNMLDILDDIKNAISVKAVFMVFATFCLVVIAVVIFFDYYDKELAHKKKSDDDNIRRIIREEKDK